MMNIIIIPFTEHEHLRMALVSCLALSLSAAPLGVFLVLRRMSLMGDAMQHAILPGVTVAYLMAGMALWPMTLGGLAAGVIVAMTAGAITRMTPLKEDASFTGMYMISLALGVVLVSLKGDPHELLHLLFGDAHTIGKDAMVLICGVATFSILTLAVIYRALVMECFDSGFMKASGGKGALVYQLFLFLVVLNLVSAFHAMGTLMALGLMVMPAITARLWARNIDSTLYCSIAFSMAASLIGLLIAHHYHLPSGAAIVLVGGGLYLLSIFTGKNGGVFTRLLPVKHLKG